jgi:hypothetical protein
VLRLLLRRFRAPLLLALAALAGGVGFAACSASKAGGGADAGAHDASVEADEDVTSDTGSGPDEVLVYPDSPSLESPDGCFRQSAPCMDGTTCCSGYCFDGGCTLMPRQQ